MLHKRCYEDVYELDYADLSEAISDWLFRNKHTKSKIVIKPKELMPRMAGPVEMTGLTVTVVREKLDTPVNIKK